MQVDVKNIETEVCIEYYVITNEDNYTILLIVSKWSVSDLPDVNLRRLFHTVRAVP